MPKLIGQVRLLWRDAVPGVVERRADLCHLEAQTARDTERVGLADALESCRESDRSPRLYVPKVLIDTD